MIIDTHIHIIVNEITQKITKDPWSPNTGYENGKPFVEFGGKRLNSALHEFVDVDKILNKQTEAGIVEKISIAYVNYSILNFCYKVYAHYDRNNSYKRNK